MSVTCVNCKTDGQPLYRDTIKGRYKIRPGIPMRKIEVRVPGKFGGKGKVIREGYVCDLCYRRLGITTLPEEVKLEPQTGKPLEG